MKVRVDYRPLLHHDKLRTVGITGAATKACIVIGIGKIETEAERARDLNCVSRS
jgi:hypothetical protein